jgi:hypothetical protein
VNNHFFLDIDNRTCNAGFRKYKKTKGKKMPSVVIKGKEQNYIFSVVSAREYSEMPDWGGVWLAVDAQSLGLRMKDCKAMGACSSFKKYESKLKSFFRNGCTHLYLLPEYDQSRRDFALEDLAKTEAFAGVFDIEKTEAQQEKEA